VPEANNRDVVIIGGGHNGLVTAFYLAKAGYKPLVLERRAQPGGAAITEEFHPGFRCSTLAHSAGPLRPDIVRDMQLQKHGLNMIATEVSVTSLSPDGRALILYKDTEKAVQEIAKFSEKDATKYPQFQASLAKMGRVIGKALTLAPPDIDNPSSGDLWGMLNTGRAVRKLGKRDMYRLLRWGPMAVADLVAEYFETELLRATVRQRKMGTAVMGKELAIPAENLHQFAHGKARLPPEKVTCLAVRWRLIWKRIYCTAPTPRRLCG
jgi:phytoene dehydrogenase-like protein